MNQMTTSLEPVFVLFLIVPQVCAVHPPSHLAPVSMQVWAYMSADVCVRKDWSSLYAIWNLADNSLTEQSDSMEAHSSNNDIELSDDTHPDQSEAFVCAEKQAAGVADAALQDGMKAAGSAFSTFDSGLYDLLFFPVPIVETLRQLILDLHEDRRSHDSDDTPTNETVTDRQQPESSETVSSFSANESEPEQVPPPDAEKPSVQIVRKGNRADPDTL